MNTDPYADVAAWLDMDARAEAMMRHPAGKGLASREVQDWQDQQACGLGSLNWQPAAEPEPEPTVWEHARAVAGLLLAFALIANTGPILDAIRVAVL